MGVGRLCKDLNPTEIKILAMYSVLDLATAQIFLMLLVCNNKHFAKQNLLFTVPKATVWLSHHVTLAPHSTALTK